MNSSKQSGPCTQHNIALHKKSTDDSIALHQQKSPSYIMNKCRQYFWDMDTNGDGKLNGSEFAEMIEHIGMTLDVSELKRAYSKVDKDGDGTITFKEFLDAYASEQAIIAGNSDTFGTEHAEILLSQEDMRDGCKYFWNSDKDCDGKLHIVEFSNMLVTLGMKLGQRDIKKAFKMADVNGDGYIRFWEFVTAYLNEIKPNILTKKKIKCIYYKNDEQHKGFLTTEEFREAMKMLGNDLHEKDLEKLITIASRDTEKLTLSDFCSFLGLE